MQDQIRNILRLKQMFWMVRRAVRLLDLPLHLRRRPAWENAKYPDAVRIHFGAQAVGNCL